jgi:hypothetical protein
VGAVIVLVTNSAAAERCGATLRARLAERVETAATLAAGAELAQELAASALVVDRALYDVDPLGAEASLGTAGGVPVVLANFAVSGAERIVAEVRAALERAERERLAARADAERRLQMQLSAALTKVLLSAQRQLHHSHLPAEAAADAHHIRRLVLEMRAALGESAESASARAVPARGRRAL